MSAPLPRHHFMNTSNADTCLHWKYCGQYVYGLHALVLGVNPQRLHPQILN